MTPAAYCQQNAAPSGSTLYYALLFLSPELRGALLPIYAFHAEISESANRSDDPGVRDARLAWWQTELQRLANGTPQHPVTQAMVEQANCQTNHTDALMKIVTAYQRYVHSQPKSDDEFLDHCRATGGALEIMAARVSDCDDEHTLRAAEELGAQIQRGEGIRRAALEPPTDSRSPSPGAIAELISALQQAIEGVPTYARPTLRCPLSRARILVAVLKKQQRTGPEHSSVPPSISPLRKLWIAWRAGAS